MFPLFALLLTAAAPAAPADSIPVAAFYLSKGDLDPALFGGVKSAMSELAARVSTIRFIADAELRRELKRAGKEGLMEALVLRCGSDVACIADLGRAVGAQQVLLVRVEPVEGAGVAFKLLAVGAADGAVLRKLKLDLPTTADAVPAALEGHAADVFGAQPAAARPAAPAQAASPASSSAVAAVPARPASAASPTGIEATAPWWRDRLVWRRAGYGAAAAGGAAILIGAAFGIRSHQLAGEVDDSTRQPRAKQLEDDANTDVHRANTSIAIGTTLLVAGAGALLWERFGGDWFGPSEATP